MTSGIYEIKNVINGKTYIGSAVNIISRWRIHVTKLSKNQHHSRHLQNAWNSIGKDNFVFSVLEYCEKEKLIEREQYYIDTLHPVYNTLPIAGSSLGNKHTPESRAKMSKSQQGKTFSSETRALISAANKGHKKNGAGKPAIYKKAMKRHNIHLSDEHVEIAISLAGEISAGIRMALELAQKSGV